MLGSISGLQHFSVRTELNKQPHYATHNLDQTIHRTSGYGGETGASDHDEVQEQQGEITQRGVGPAKTIEVQPDVACVRAQSVLGPDRCISFLTEPSRVHGGELSSKRVFT